jgi:hypothetical protein
LKNVWNAGMEVPSCDRRVEKVLVEVIQIDKTILTVSMRVMILGNRKWMYLGQAEGPARTASF